MQQLKERSGSVQAQRGDLLLVDDDEVFSQVLARALERRGFRVHRERNVESAIAGVTDGATQPDFAVLDLNLGGASGMRVIGPLRRSNQHCRIVVLTGYASIATAVDAIKLGADHYLAKPVDVDDIVRTLLETPPPDTEAAPTRWPTVKKIEWEHIQRVYAENRGNISATARALKMHRRTLQRKLCKPPGGPSRGGSLRDRDCDKMSQLQGVPH